ncbi:anti-sigma factor family protein [Brevibacillus thermoruber]|uniref:anti-sigma factor family protein n=1 Tax=Brevibacillus thermoruber TaxID=33942 RepID=UPI001E5019FD|nr:zf-HC2 domain-containing protein [Brevibacillus thermoruber]
MIALIHEFLDGEIDELSNQKLQSHLQACATCRRHLHELQRASPLSRARLMFMSRRILPLAFLRNCRLLPRQGVFPTGCGIIRSSRRRLSFSF